MRTASVIVPSGKTVPWTVSSLASMALLLWVALACACCHPGGEGLRALFAPICHQQPDRCLWWLGHPTGLCARCLALYVGLAAGLWLAAARPSRERTARRLFFTAAGLLLLDVLLERLSLIPNTPVLRGATGFGLGVAWAPFVLCGLTELVSSRTHHQGIP